MVVRNNSRSSRRSASAASSPSRSRRSVAASASTASRNTTPSRDAFDPVRLDDLSVDSGRSRDGSCSRIARSSDRSSTPGSMPRSCASTWRARWYVRSASAWRPVRYSATMRRCQRRSRSGSASTMAASSAISSVWCPRSSSRVASSSMAVRRSSASRVLSCSARLHPARSVKGVPRQRHRASRREHAAPAASPTLLDCRATRARGLRSGGRRSTAPRRPADTRAAACRSVMRRAVYAVGARSSGWSSPPFGVECHPRARRTGGRRSRPRRLGGAAH